MQQDRRLPAGSMSRPPANRLRSVARAGGHALQHLVINAFLLFHLLAITCWAIPFANPLTALSRSAVRPYFLWAGLFQSWDMFSPIPKSSNIYVKEIVISEDGNTRNRTLPWLELLNLKGRYCKERYRKFVENLTADAHAELWPGAARFIA